MDIIFPTASQGVNNFMHENILKTTNMSINLNTRFKEIHLNVHFYFCWKLCTSSGNICHKLNEYTGYFHRRYDVSATRRHGFDL